MPKAPRKADCTEALEAIRKVREIMRENIAPGSKLSDSEALSRIYREVDNDRINEAVTDDEAPADPKDHQPHAGYYPAG